MSTVEASHLDFLRRFMGVGCFGGGISASSGGVGGPALARADDLVRIVGVGVAESVMPMVAG